MEKSTRNGCARLVSCSIIALLLGGCFHKPVKPSEPVRAKSETELAVAAIDREWLKKCEGLSGQMPDNQVGALLQDYVDVATPLAECMKRHNSLVDYLDPVIKKERATQR